jgi:hypothetical protein
LTLSPNPLLEEIIEVKPPNSSLSPNSTKKT